MRTLLWVGVVAGFHAMPRLPHRATRATPARRPTVVARASVQERPVYPRSSYNAPILTGLFVCAMSALLFRDALAIKALYEYDSIMEADWLPESMKLLARLPTDLLADYGAAAVAKPIFVKACTSAVAYLIGDLVAQAYEGRREIAVLDLQRAFRNAASGFFLHGPILHYWIMFLEGPVSRHFCDALHLSIVPNSPAEYSLIVLKIALDQTLFALGFNTLYTVALGALAARQVDDIVTNVKQTIVPSMVSSWRFWPIVHLLSYSPIVPIEYKLLYIDVCEIFWVAILSFVANDQKLTQHVEDQGPPALDFDVQPAVEVLLVSNLQVAANKTAVVLRQDDNATLAPVPVLQEPLRPTPL